MSLFRNENPNLGHLSDVEWLSGSHNLLARDTYALPIASPGATPIYNIDPNLQRTYVITAAAPTTFTLGAPSLGPKVVAPGNGPLSDGKIITIWSDTNYAHIISAPGLLLTGATSTPADYVLFPSYAGASVELMAYQGMWLVCGCGGVSFGAGAPGGLQLGFAATYAIGAQASISNTGSTTINGNAYLSPGSSITGSPTITGRTDVDNANALAAEAAVLAAWNDGTTRASNGALPGSLNSYTITPGVFTVASSTGTTGAANVNFDAQGNPNAVFIEQIGTTLTFGAGTTITLLNGALARNIWWLVGSSATFAGTGSPAFDGNILAAVSISLGTAGTSVGRFFAGAAGNNTGALTFAGGNTVTIPS